MPYIIVNGTMAEHYEKLEDGGSVCGLPKDEVEKLQCFFPNPFHTDNNRFQVSPNLILDALTGLGYSIACSCITPFVPDNKAAITWTLRK